MSLVGDRLREAREKKGYSQVQVKERTGGKINNKTLSGYEKGVSEPDLESLNLLCNLYEVTVDWVCGRTNDPTQTLSDGTRSFVDALELTDDEIIKRFPLTIDGRPLTRDEARNFIAFVRASRNMN